MHPFGRWLDRFSSPRKSRRRAAAKDAAKKRRMLLEQLEARHLMAVVTSYSAGVLTFTGDANANQVTLESTGTSGTVAYNDGNGASTQANVTQVVFNGSGGDDELIVTQQSPHIFAPSGGIQFDGGAGSDLLTLAGGSVSTFTSGSFGITGAASATVSYATTSGTINLSVTTLEAINDTTAAGTHTTTGTAGIDSLTIEPGATLGGQATTKISGSFPTMQVGQKSDLVLDSAGGDDTILVKGDVTSLNALPVPLTINGGTGTNTLTITDTADTSADSISIDAVSPATSDLYRVEGVGAAAGNDIVFRDVTTLTITATQGSDTLDARFVDTTPANDLRTVTLNGWTGADQFYLFTSNQKGGTGTGLTPTGIASGVTSVALNGDSTGNPNSDDGNDIFGEIPYSSYALSGLPGFSVGSNVRMLRPSTTTALTVNGGKPTGPTSPTNDNIGDTINIDVSGVPTTKPIVWGTLTTGSTSLFSFSEVAAFSCIEIEDGNLVDNGILTDAHQSDIYVRGTNGNDLIQFQGTANANSSVVKANAYQASYWIYGKTVAYGRAGNDTIHQMTFPHSAEFYGEDGSDIMSGGLYADKLVGGAGNDQIQGYAGNNTFWGDRDPVEVGLEDTVANRAFVASDTSGAGSAYHSTAGVTYGDSMSMGAGNDVVYAGPGNDGTAGNSINTGSGDDWFYGGTGDDVVFAGAGNDRLYGGEGNDSLTGSEGDDLVAGNAGNDSLHGNAGSDIVIGGLGTDSVYGDENSNQVFDGSVTVTSSVGTAQLGNDQSQAFGDAGDLAMADLASDWAADLAFGQVVAAYVEGPVALNDAYETNEDQALQIVVAGVLLNDTEATTAELVAGPAHGSLTLNTDGSFSYTPSANYSGTDSFTYRFPVGEGYSNTATVTLTIHSVDEAPAFSASSYELLIDENSSAGSAVGQRPCH